MADDSVDLKFLGRQVQVLQGDVRDLRASETRRDAEVAAVRADLARMQAENHAKFEQVDDRFDRLEARVDRLENRVQAGFAAVEAKFAAVDARFQQASETAATNLQIVLSAIAGLERKIDGKT